MNALTIQPPHRIGATAHLRHQLCTPSMTLLFTPDAAPTEERLALAAALLAGLPFTIVPKEGAPDAP
jgi:hypothetical protein